MIQATVKVFVILKISGGGSELTILVCLRLCSTQKGSVGRCQFEIKKLKGVSLKGNPRDYNICNTGRFSSFVLKNQRKK